MASRQHNANKEALFAKSSPVAGKAGGAGGPTTFTTPAPKPASRPTSTFTTATNVGVRPDQPKRMDLNKLKEAEEYRGKASKALKTSMFGKWKPDYLNAAPYFERAASLYRAGGAEEQAKEMFLKAADCNEHLSTFAAAASNFKQAATLAKDADEEEEAAKLFAKEADMWAIGGETGRAADALLKAAEAREDTSPGHAIDYCLQACDLLCPDVNDPLDLKRAPLASDVFIKCLNMALRNERAKEALVIATKGAATVKGQSLTSALYKLYATQTILQLYLGDVVAADKTFMEVHIQDSGYIRSPECEVGENLLQAAKENDATALEEAIKGVQKAYLDNNIIKMAKRLTLDRINGLLPEAEEEEEEEEEAASPSTSQRSVPLPQRRSGPQAVSPNDVRVNLDHVDKSLELSEEEKASLRAKPAFGMGPVPAAAAVPAPVQRRPQPPSPPPQVGMPTDQPGSGLMDLSDLQDGLDAAGEDDDFDLDAAIEAARQQAGAVDGDDDTFAPAPAPAPIPAPAPAPIPVSAPAPAPAPLPSLPTPTFAQPAYVAPVAPPAKPTPPKPPKRVSEVPASFSPTYDATHGPYSPGYDIDIAAPAPPATQAQEEEEDDFLR